MARSTCDTGGRQRAYHDQPVYNGGYGSGHGREAGHRRNVRRTK
ncbi:hypothetical protein BZL30_2855 [Mycobacterium kansasii]|uniref:Uncharacterized protein n=1 Tax=Mycobacterium kansasii TaxID=1768 RepID=A0A1V3XH68_MYCKA|nr:hypothetical protein BZL30_2855 [Mycobacterium kansasii]OOK80070.1 hypothetical protein BZL29_2791 [Mycobacterium kansasii]